MVDTIGIVNMEVYFPAQFVDQAELEEFDGVAKGKYTVGLGQTRMGFCNDLEDVNSLCLTVVAALIRKSKISYADVGRLEVGTETLVDKSKGVKTALMRLFEGSGNSDVEGVDSTNACYGGTAALFNCLNWCKESADYDGRYAIAVCADIAVYARGNARPTGGAGAVAMLIGRNAALVMDHGLRATHVEDVYDFYKPVQLSSEYPLVDGPLSIHCYLRALDRCYQLYRLKASRKASAVATADLHSFDAVVFHSPFCKLVQKSLARLSLNDFVATPKAERAARFPGMEAFVGVELDNTYFDREVERAFLDHSRAAFEAKTKPSLLLATNVGNMYTPSLYGGLVSYLCAAPRTAADLAGKRIGLFSYGSGLVASFFSLSVSTDPDSSLALLLSSVSDVMDRLESRTKVSPADFDRTMQLREAAYAEKSVPYSPKADPAGLLPGTWYLSGVDERHRREYMLAPTVQNGH